MRGRDRLGVETDQEVKPLSQSSTRRQQSRNQKVGHPLFSLTTYPFSATPHGKYQTMTLVCYESAPTAFEINARGYLRHPAPSVFPDLHR